LGKATRTAEGCKTGSGRRGRKRLEPHGWKQGATNLQGSVRSKPSESGGTTRAEGVRCLATSGRRRINLRVEELGEDSWSSKQRRGDLWKISREEVWKSREMTAGSFGGTQESSEMRRTAHTGWCLRRRREGHEGRADGCKKLKAGPCRVGLEGWVLRHQDHGGW
jgi:hypothetical protein